MNILYDYQVFHAQRVGGVSRYHIELMKKINETYETKADIPAVCLKNMYLAEIKNKRPWNINNDFIQRIINKCNEINTYIHARIKKYSIIHPTWYGEYILRMPKRSKLVITIHDMIQEVFGTDAITAERKRKAIYAADAIIAISENTKKDILKFYPDVNPQKITVIYHGTNHLPEPVCPDGFQVPQKYILYVGARTEYKNAALLMKAFANVFYNHKDISLLFVGGGEFNKKEKEWLIQLGIGERVIQQNVSDAELAYLYQNAICFVYPSKYEGFGFPILEAFDNQCPVICSNASCLPEVGADAALYFDPDSCDELSERLRLFVQNENIRQQYIRKGCERVQVFSWKKTAQKTLELYSSLIENK